MKPGQEEDKLMWLNDEIINFYMRMLIDKENSHEGIESSFALETHFYEKLMDLNKTKMYSYDKVTRWTKKRNIFKLKRLYLPINIRRMHWFLVVILMQVKRIVVYDPMGLQEAKGKAIYCDNLMLVIKSLEIKNKLKYSSR